MTGQQSDMGFEPEKPAARAPRGSKVARLTGRVKRARVNLRGLEVTQEDIDLAMQENSNHCMIADAIKRQIPGAANVQVDIATIRYTDTKKSRRVLCLTPLSCQRPLVAFDLGKFVKPFRFNLLSTQVTAVTVSKPKLDADGNAVKRARVVRYRRKDGSVTEFVTDESIRETVAKPTAVKEVDGVWKGSGREKAEHIVGGRLPPGHRPSMNRKFGAKAFTWNDDEDKEVVSVRMRNAWGDVDPLAGYYIDPKDEGGV